MFCQTGLSCTYLDTTVLYSSLYNYVFHQVRMGSVIYLGRENIENKKCPIYVYTYILTINTYKHIVTEMQQPKSYQ
jgi:hypothetical protein